MVDQLHRLMGMSLARTIIYCGASYLALIAVFIALLALAISLSSDARIESHLREAVEQGMILPEEDPRAMSPYGHAGHEFGMSTECVALTTNLSNESDTLFYRIAASPWVVPDLRNIKSCFSLS